MLSSLFSSLFFRLRSLTDAWTRTTVKTQGEGGIKCWVLTIHSGTHSASNYHKQSNTVQAVIHYNCREAILNKFTLKTGLNIHCLKILKKSDLDGWMNYSIRNLHWRKLYNLFKTKWRNNGQWKPKSWTHWGLDSKSHQSNLWCDSVVCMALACLYLQNSYVPPPSLICISYFVLVSQVSPAGLVPNVVT